MPKTHITNLQRIRLVW